LAKLKPCHAKLFEESSTPPLNTYHMNESKLISSLHAWRKYSTRDLADLTFCHMLALHMCRQEFETAPWSRQYAANSLDTNDWQHTRLNRTDLHQLLNVLIAQPHASLTYLKQSDASRLLMQEIHISPHVVTRFLRNIQQVNFDPELSGRMLLQMERALKITVSNYKSMRRILSDWHLPHVDTEAKSLVITRLLQMLRARAVQGDIIHKVEQLAKARKWEIAHACDPETGRNCDAAATTQEPKKPSLIKQLAIGAGLGVGAYLLGRALFGGNK
jgi:hypothetical protein